jgi:hypothetical protein
MTFATMFQLILQKNSIKLWQSPIKLICLLYLYIVESIFQLHSYLPNIPDIDDVSKLNFQLCW